MSKLEAIYTKSFFCSFCSKSFAEPIDFFEFGDSKKMAIELGRVKHKCVYCDDTRKLEVTIFREFILTTNIIVKKEPKTVGHWASRNTETLGRAKVEDKDAAYKQGRRDAAKKTAEAAGGKLIERDKSAKPWWRDGSIPGTKKYDKATDLPEIKNIEKYVKTGEV